ncbi:MAG: TA system VapC family ribonuclease toxin [Akkermansiaceae bacterium]|jgi:toxin-antitoxin system PIN domain toxin|nr:PIN domain-containing protein [Luteolibacter sp.]
MRYLLDINVLIALLDPNHTFHRLAHQWWSHDDRPWASCPITENGLIRIMASTSYSKNSQLSVADVTTLLSVFTANTNHEFWSDHISFRDENEFQHTSILSSKHLTDIYLLALAAKNNATLVTFDQNIPLTPVTSAKPENLLIL